MANLLYVTSEVLQKLRQHPAYLFWHAFVQNTPIRIVSLEERSFHPRDIKAEENHIYLTIDMKFAYCRNKMFSFMYETQDLSFRLQATDGILRTLDNKQFTALIGKIAVASSTTDIDLVNADRVYHPLFDSGYFGKTNGAVAAATTATADKPKSKSKAKGRTKSKRKTSKASPDKDADAKAPIDNKEDANGLILGQFDKSLCDEIVSFRNSSKKSYKYLAERFDLAASQVKEICNHYKQMEQVAATSRATRDALKSIPKDVQEEIVRMKKVSKKSYKYLAEKFKLPVDTVQDICAQYLRRPRKRQKS